MAYTVSTLNLIRAASEAMAVTVPDTVHPGKYRLRIVVKPDGKEDWRVARNAPCVGMVRRLSINVNHWRRLYGSQVQDGVNREFLFPRFGALVVDFHRRSPVEFERADPSKTRLNFGRSMYIRHIRSPILTRYFASITTTAVPLSRTVSNSALSQISRNRQTFLCQNQYRKA
jgi:hypothetical protein